jgi:pyruvate,water dikinase
MAALTAMPGRPRYIRFFGEIGSGDVAQVGGKNASLGEMFRALTPRGVLVPDGFAVTAEAYRDTLAQGGALQALEQALRGIDPANVPDLAARAARARGIVAGARLSRRLAHEIRAAHARLVEAYGAGLSVAVRSSATAEDLPGASFAGQHETYLNVRGERSLLAAVRRCFASLFTDRAIRYRIDRGYDHLKVYNSVGVMKMVRSDLAASGVTFTLDTETGFRDVVFITGSWGLGENVVQGAVEPDEFTVFKPTFRMGKRAVLRRTLGAKHLKLVYAGGGRRSATRNLRTPPGERRRYCLSDDEVLALADQAIAIEEHYSAQARASRPMDIEWAKDGSDGRLYTVQARPETVVSQRRAAVLERYLLRGAGEVRLTGHAVGHRIAAGAARVVRDSAELAAFRPGEVLVAEMTTPDWGTVMKTAAAIVTDRGGRTCHAAIVARELGIPAVVGTEVATRALRSGETVTVSCAEGDIGKVYAARVPYEVERIDLTRLERPATHIEVNIGTPEQAFATSFLPNDGVGLARMETIIAGTVKAHPMALAHPERVADARERSAIERLAANDATPAAFLVRVLAEGVGTIAAAFYPKPVVVRMSDFKSNEYANLLGGRAFETPEENPMLGFRGAARYTHPAYADGFALECAAMKRVRDDMGLTNVRLMIPFCRRVEEAERVVARMRELGLGRGENGLEIYVMCEIPNNVLQIDAFARHFDGFSIGSNDLTQLALGVDRDSEIVAFDFDERDAGVRELIRLAVVGARRNGRHCGICGQAPSDYPEFAEYLVRLGIDAISLNPDAVLETTQRVLAIERELGRPARQPARS